MSRKQHALTALISILAGMALYIGCSEPGSQSLYPLNLVSAVEVADWCPVADEENISIDSNLWVRFSGPVDVNSITRYSILLGSGREHIRGQVTYDPNTHTVFYYPYQRLTPNTRYELFVTEDVKDIYGRQVLEKFTAITFFTGDPGDVVCPADPFAEVPGREYENEFEGEWETEGDGDVEADAGDGEDVEQAEGAETAGEDSEDEGTSEADGDGES